LNTTLENAFWSRKWGTIYFKSTQILEYADDTDIIYTSETAVIEAFINTDKEVQKMGLGIN
jgi:hypothetical protein